MNLLNEFKDRQLLKNSATLLYDPFSFSINKIKKCF